MAGWTNKGKAHYLDMVVRNATEPTVYYLALFTVATAPVADTNTFSQLTQIATGAGYSTGGTSLARNSTDFDVLTEDDTNDVAFAQIKDIVWTASGDTIPASGAGARYACMTDDNGTEGSRIIIHYWDLVSEHIVSDGQTLTLQNCEIRLTE